MKNTIEGFVGETSDLKGEEGFEQIYNRVREEYRGFERRIGDLMQNIRILKSGMGDLKRGRVICRNIRDLKVNIWNLQEVRELKEI